MRSGFTLEIGMPHLGRHNLSESALFKAVGHDRWMQIEERGGTPTSLIRDEAGARLYATFFYLELNFPPQRPLAAYRENDAMRFRTTLAHHARCYLDGRHTLDPDGGAWVRSSNAFTYPEGGPSKLAISPPANVDFAAIPELPEAAEPLDLCRRARARGVFFDPEPGDAELFAGEREFAYEIDADRDLNGAGLVYFANFISFLDLAERRLLSAPPRPVPAPLLDARSTYRRRIGYYGNARADDRFLIRVRAAARMIEGAPGVPLLDLALHHAVTRSSDGKQIVISSCRKVSRVGGEAGVADWLRGAGLIA
ncbi:MAG TPA: LnmK family bifunctional acyltransferase/decarboxylase [Pyrinomonadaceae bacterium]|nr:LnmK family bifunctional acyltransferase/decarboxylase [Pyrinomonadaceae bacterium]